jgi:hypothetical protein
MEDTPKYFLKIKLALVSKCFIYSHAFQLSLNGMVIKKKKFNFFSFIYRWQIGYWNTFNAGFVDNSLSLHG